MPVTVIEMTREALIARRDRLLEQVRMSEDELRERAKAEAVTADERSTLSTLNEIAFLLDDDQ